MKKRETKIESNKEIKGIIKEYIKKNIKKGKKIEIIKEKIKEEIIKTYKLNKTEEIKEEREQINQNEEIFNGLKEEILKIFLELLGKKKKIKKMKGEWGITIYEWKEVIRSSLNFIQMKEKQYRKLPREAIEKIFENIVPNNR
jgi:hypothetical protein